MSDDHASTAITSTTHAGGRWDEASCAAIDCIWRRRRLTTEALRKLVTNSRTRHYVHPAYRALMNGVGRSAAMEWEKLAALQASDEAKHCKQTVYSAALKAKKRALLKRPLPRVPIFRCAKCLLASNRLSLVASHVCLKKLPPPVDQQIVANILRQGVRCKAKDSHSFMERLPAPQALKFEKITAAKHIEWSVEKASSAPTGRTPPSLVDLALKQVQLIHLDFETLVEAVEPITSLHSGEAEDADPNDDLVATFDGTGWYCPKCSRLFPRYMDFDEHLLAVHYPDEAQASSMVPVEPLDIETCKSSRHPTSGRLMTSPRARRVRRPHLRDFDCDDDFGHTLLPNGGTASVLDGGTNGNGAHSTNGNNSGSGSEEDAHFEWRCTKCRKDDFVELADLHIHIFECALK